jgi:hypothetical protein
MFRAILCPSLGALDRVLQLMVFCTQFCSRAVVRRAEAQAGIRTHNPSGRAAVDLTPYTARPRGPAHELGLKNDLLNWMLRTKEAKIRIPQLRISTSGALF